VRNVFEAPTVCDLAGVIASRAMRRTPRYRNCREPGAWQAFPCLLRNSACGFSISMSPTLLSTRWRLRYACAAFSKIVRRHEALCTSFAIVDGAPVQIIHPPGGFAVNLLDLTHLQRRLARPKLCAWPRKK